MTRLPVTKTPKPYVGGAFIRSESGRTYPLRDAAGAFFANLPQCTRKDLRNAVEAAAKAGPGWARRTAYNRGQILYRLGEMLEARRAEMIDTLARFGAARSAATREVDAATDRLVHYAGWADKLGHAGYGTDPRPLGVAGQVIPWNFPLLMLAWKVAPALAAGNTVVLKPAEYTPLTAIRFAELAAQAGLPPGVFNLVNGDGTTGAALVAHPGIDKVAFTGSTEVGRAIRVATAGSGKALSLELGGKSPFLVFDDADSIFFDDNSLNLLKAACDSTEKRTISYLAESMMEDEDGGRIPKTFRFEGTIIFITNFDMDDAIDRGHRLEEHFKALVSRAHYIDMAMKTRRDYIVRIKQVVGDGMLRMAGYNLEEQTDVMRFLDKNQDQLRELSLRMVLKLAAVRRSSPTKFESMARVTCCKTR